MPWKGQFTKLKKSGKFYIATHAVQVELVVRRKMLRNDRTQAPDMDCRNMSIKNPWAVIETFRDIKVKMNVFDSATDFLRQKWKHQMRFTEQHIQFCWALVVIIVCFLHNLCSINQVLRLFSWYIFVSHLFVFFYFCWTEDSFVFFFQNVFCIYI